MRTTFLVRFSYDAIAPPSDAAARAPGVVQRDCSPVRLHVVRMSYVGCRVHSNSVCGYLDSDVLVHLGPDAREKLFVGRGKVDEKVVQLHCTDMLH
jgi:hypothetical protein